MEEDIYREKRQIPSKNIIISQMEESVSLKTILHLPTYRASYTKIS